MQGSFNVWTDHKKGHNKVHLLHATSQGSVSEAVQVYLLHLCVPSISFWPISFFHVLSLSIVKEEKKPTRFNKTQKKESCFLFSSTPVGLCWFPFISVFWYHSNRWTLPRTWTTTQVDYQSLSVWRGLCSVPATGVLYSRHTASVHVVCTVDVKTDRSTDHLLPDLRWRTWPGLSPCRDTCSCMTRCCCSVRSERRPPTATRRLRPTASNTRWRSETDAVSLCLTARYLAKWPL